ncbi:sporulation histidine kinase inhibitor Sda [Sporosarcina sp. FA9]
MKNMSNELLMDCYHQAIILKLCPGFIELIEDEIRRRSESFYQTKISL